MRNLSRAQTIISAHLNNISRVSGVFPSNPAARASCPCIHAKTFLIPTDLEDPPLQIQSILFDCLLKGLLEITKYYLIILKG